VPQVRPWQELELDACRDVPALIAEIVAAGEGSLAPAERRHLEAAAARANEAIEAYAGWLRQTLTGAAEDWAIGTNAYDELVRLLVSVRSPDDLYYRSEIVGPETTVIYTRQAPAGERRLPGRLAAADVAPFAGTDATFYVCGSARFAEAATQLLVDNGNPTEAIRVERFGPTG
jgi:hypothetical protein